MSKNNGLENSVCVYSFVYVRERRQRENTHDKASVVKRKHLGKVG